MRDYLRTCAAMEAKNGAVPVWSRAMEMEATSLSPSKRLKVDSHTLNSPDNSVSVSSPESSSTPATSFCANGVQRSVSLDLSTRAEVLESTHHLSTFFIGALREKIQLSELNGVSQEIKSSTAAMKTKALTAALNTHRKPNSAAKMPSAAEIDEFFSAAEKIQQKRFTEKYNYDIVKDVPLEGRYQWVRLKP